MTSEAMLLILGSPPPRVPPAQPVAHDYPGMEATDTVVVSVSWCLVQASRHDGDRLRLPLSSSLSELSPSWSFLSLFAPLLFAKRDRACAAPIALR